MSLLGIDLGGTKLGAGVFSKDGDLISREEHTVAGKAGDDVGKLVTDTIGSLLNAKHSPIEAIGISVPGISNRKNGTVWAPNIPGWDQYPLLGEVQKVVGDDIPVSVDSDRSCYILGEMWQGNAKGCDNAIFIAVGTGIGAGIVSDGRVIHGANDIAGAIGWMALQPPFKDEYTSCGCFELNASGAGIAKMATQYLNDDLSYDGPLRHKRDITAHDVIAAYNADDVIGVKVIENAIVQWAMAIANLISIFNPEKIILGGGVFGPAVRFIPAIHKEVMKWAQPISAQQMSIEPSLLGGAAGIYGAGYLALQLLADK